MLRRLLINFALAMGLWTVCVPAQAGGDLPYRGLAIAAPPPDQLDRFVRLVEDELAPRGLNLLILRVDYNFEFRSHPELVSPHPFSREQVGQLVAMGRRAGVRIVPQINLLGHQSWHSSLGPLLTHYPQFDETPGISLPETYVWPNEDGLYCKSYCPLHPEVHSVVFAVVDELLDAFEADAFHAGMDEVFYIAHPDCPRCSGKDPAELFAGEVTRIRDHLRRQDRELWIWGDRLIDGKATGIGEWEASTNNTHGAIDLIPKDVVINDWHYEKAYPTPAWFAEKGFRVLAASWDQAEVGLEQQKQALAFRDSSAPELAARHLGILHTWWSGAESFMDYFEGVSMESPDERSLGAMETFRKLFPQP